MRIVIADDHGIVRKGLKLLINKQADMEVIGETEDGLTAARLAKELVPEIVIMDISMPNLNGIQATQLIRHENPNTRIVVLSMYFNKNFVMETLNAGALGYVLKSCVFDELLRAIRTVAANEHYLSPRIADILVEDYISHQRAANNESIGSRLPNGLSSGESRQTEVACDGRTFSLTFAPVIKANYVNVYGLDITERKSAEEQVQEYQRRLRSLASELSLAEERQRHRIATELHDNTSQELAFALTKLQNIRETASADVLESLDDVCEMMSKVVENIRNMTFDICSPTLYKFGLETAVSELLEDKLGERDEVSYSFSDDKKAKPLSEDIQVALFQSVRELLNNTIKHAWAHNVAVDIQKCENTIKDHSE